MATCTSNRVASETAMALIKFNAGLLKLLGGRSIHDGSERKDSQVSAKYIKIKYSLAYKGGCCRTQVAQKLEVAEEIVLLLHYRQL